MKTIIVTGAYGVLGSEIVKRIVESERYKVIALVRSISDSKRLQEDILRKIEIFKTDTQELENLFKMYKVDGIIHTATLYGKKETIGELIRNNIVFPIELIELASLHKVAFFINTDSYFNKFHEYQYLGNYTLSKKHLEDWLRKIEKLKIFNLKLEHIYSENDTERKFVNQILNQIFAEIEYIKLTEGTQKRDFIHISDVVEFYWVLIEGADKFENGFYEFEIGTGNSHSIREFVLKVKEVFNNNKTELRFGTIPSRENEISESKADLSKIPISLDWSPSISIEEGLKLIKDRWKN